MKKQAIDYLKSIWFKIENDQMTRNEAIILTLLLFGGSFGMIYLVQSIFKN